MQDWVEESSLDHWVFRLFTPKCVFSHLSATFYKWVYFFTHKCDFAHLGVKHLKQFDRRSMIFFFFFEKASSFRPWDSYCIHVDVKANENVKQAVRSLVNCYSTVSGLDFSYRKFKLFYHKHSSNKMKILSRLRLFELISKEDKATEKYYKTIITTWYWI